MLSLDSSFFPAIEYMRGKSGKYILTKEIAEDLRRRNSENRTLRPKVIDKYRRDMLSGKWHYTGEAISVSSSGVLLNGQHRVESYLSAVEENERLEIPVRIEFGIDPGAKSVIDVGAPRHAHDILKINRDAPYCAQTATAIRYLFYYSKVGLVNGVNGAYQVSTQELLDFYDNHPDLGNFFAVCRDNGWMTRHLKTYLGQGIAAFCWYVLSRVNEEEANRFFEAYAKGLELKETDVAYQLRERLMTAHERGRGQRLERVQKIALVFKSWNIFVGYDSYSGRSRKEWNAKLRWTVADSQELPRIKGDKLAMVKHTFVTSGSNRNLGDTEEELCLVSKVSQEYRPRTGQIR